MMADAYLAQIAALLPPGPALPREADSALMRLLAVPAAELARVDGRAVALLEEGDPRLTAELLGEWERVAGLPDPCLGATPTIAQRRARLVQQLTQTRGQSRAFFLGVASALGYPGATITEFREHDCERDCEQPLLDTPWRFAWRITVAGGAVTDLTCEDTVDTPLAVWGDTALECVIRALAPAHTVPLFATS